jgi:Chemotaxis phosphatase CheX
MKAKVIGLDEWLKSLKDATKDLQETSLRFDASAKSEPASKYDEKRPGAYIAVLGEHNSMHLGLCTTPHGCRALARGLLGMRSEEELSDRDAIDGVNEVMNIIAGKVKSRMTGRDGTLRLGMPIFMETPIQMRDNVERVSVEVKIGPVPVELLVFRSKRAA